MLSLRLNSGGSRYMFSIWQHPEVVYHYVEDVDPNLVRGTSDENKMLAEIPRTDLFNLSISFGGSRHDHLLQAYLLSRLHSSSYHRESPMSHRQKCNQFAEPETDGAVGQAHVG